MDYLLLKLIVAQKPDLMELPQQLLARGFELKKRCLSFQSYYLAIPQTINRTQVSAALLAKNVSHQLLGLFTCSKYLLVDSELREFYLRIRFESWWRVKDLNLRRQSRGIYSPLPLAARATRQGLLSAVKSKAFLFL